MFWKIIYDQDARNEDRYPCVFTKPKWQMGLVNLNFADVSDFDELVNNSFQVKLFLSIK